MLRNRVCLRNVGGGEGRFVFAGILPFVSVEVT